MELRAYLWYNVCMSIGSFIAKRPYLIWYTRNFKRLSQEAALEAVLNYGDFDDVRTLLSLVGIQKAYTIFKKQLRQKRVNYRPEIANYFKLYFKRHA